MDLREILASVRRQWAAAMVGILVTVGLGVGVVLVVPPSYEYEANIVLLPPRTSVESGGNPYLLLGGMTQPLDVLSVSLQDQQTLDLVHRIDPDAEVAVAPDANSSGPILVVTADASSATRARAVRDAVVGLVPTRLAALQDQLDIVSRAQITSLVLTSDDVPKVVNKTRLRAAVAVIGLGLMSTLLAIALLDGRIIKGRRRGAPAAAAKAGRTSQVRKADPASRSAESSDDADQDGADGSSAAQPPAAVGAAAGVDESDNTWSWDVKPESESRLTEHAPA